MLLKRLKQLRIDNNLKQEEVANLIGVARTTYAMYEQGKREMDYELIVKVADYFQVSLDYLFNRTNNPIHTESYTQDEIEFINRTLAVYRDLKNEIK